MVRSVQEWPGVARNGQEWVVAGGGQEWSGVVRSGQERPGGQEWPGMARSGPGGQQRHEIIPPVLPGGISSCQSSDLRA